MNSMKGIQASKHLPSWASGNCVRRKWSQIPQYFVSLNDGVTKAQIPRLQPSQHTIAVVSSSLPSSISFSLAFVLQYRSLLGLSAFFKLRSPNPQHEHRYMSAYGADLTLKLTGALIVYLFTYWMVPFLNFLVDVPQKVKAELQLL